MMAFSPTEYTTELNGDVPWAKPVGNLLDAIESCESWDFLRFSKMKDQNPTDHFQGISEAFNDASPVSMVVFVERCILTPFCITVRVCPFAAIVLIIRLLDI